jgi:Flp pilus assembly protein TadG
MKRHTSDRARQDGFALVYMAVTLTGLLIFTGLAVDSGRAYVVKAQLTKAVDGAALGAARNLNSGDPRGEATRIFQANFPAGYMGTSSATDPTSDPGFFSLATDAGTGVNTVTVTAAAVLPTTFMKLVNFNQVTVGSSGQATRRMVDLSLVLDVSSSIGSQWTTVRDAVREFVNSFDQLHDRMALLTFSNGAQVLDAMPAGRGFDKTRIMNDVPNTLPGGSTNMVEGLYRGWDELRSVPLGTQSGVRVIVLFTDGASNGVPGNWDGAAFAKSIRTADFPKNLPDPDGQTWMAPAFGGLFNTATGAQAGVVNATGDATSKPAMKSVVLPSPYQFMPPTTWHTQSRSAGIPTTFPFQTNGLNVNGVAQSTQRPMIPDPVTGKYKSTLWNINNAARNVLEIIADQARNDNGDYRIRVYTIGMGDLVRYVLGTMPERPEDILKRISNDASSPDFNSAQLEGRYFFAPTAADVSPAFQGIQNQILRLSR